MRALPLGLLLALPLATAGCQWEGRPDGGAAAERTGDVRQPAARLDPVPLNEGPVVEPVEGVDAPDAAPVDLTQPPPTTGTADATSEVEEALTPGTEQ